MIRTTCIYCKVKPADICYIRYIFEACDGIAVVTTLDKTTNDIVVRAAPGCEADVVDVLNGLQAEIEITYQMMDKNAL